MSELYQGPTMSGLLLRALRRWGDRPAFTGHGPSLTYAQALDLIGRYQAVMQAHGVRKGQRMALLNSNRADAYLAGMAAVSLGVCMTPLHPLGSLEDHLFILGDARIDHLVVDIGAYLERGADLAAVERVRNVFTLGAADYGTDLAAAAEQAGSVTAKDLASLADEAWIVYTGGTTGQPKGVLRSHPSFVAMTNAVLADFEWPLENHSYLSVAPISHVGGTKLLPTLLRGGRVHFHHGFDAERILHDIEHERLSTTLLVPTMIYLLLDHPKLESADLSSLEMLIYGASPMSPTRLMEGLERIGPKFCQLYGQSECYPISVLRKGDHDTARPDRFASCGHPCSNVEVALLDEAGQPVESGGIGEICARAAQAMDGYWQRPEQNAETMAGGWLHTGDMARADEQGYLYIVDRKKDLIISGGFNVFPREVEDILTADPTVAMAAVIGVPDEKWGEAVKAVVVPRAGQTVDTAALVEAVKAKKGSVHAPKSVEIAEAIPLTAIGKPDKKALREQYWAGRDRMVG